MAKDSVPLPAVDVGSLPCGTPSERPNPLLPRSRVGCQVRGDVRVIRFNSSRRIVFAYDDDKDKND